MKAGTWIGLIAHFVLGLLFPYVFVGSVVLLYGFMTPPTDAEKTKGLLIAFFYIGLIIVINWLVLRRLAGRRRWQGLLIHAVVFLIAAASMFASLRWS